MANEGNPQVASTNQVDSPKIDRDQLLEDVNTKVDFRNMVTHKFTTTAEESFNHNLGRVPNGSHIAGQDKASNIFVNISKSTKQKLYATSSVINTTAKFLLY
jgi:hypothetical protein